MASRFKFLSIFCVRTFGSLCNTNGLRKYLPTPTFVEVTSISKTRLSDFLLGPLPRFPPLSKATVILSELREPTPTINDGKQVDAPKPRKREKVPFTTVTRRWQNVKVCKFPWAEGEFDAAGNLIGVVYKICNSVSSQKKIMVPKDDNLEKHKGKRSYKFNGERYVDLKKNDTYIIRDCKHL